MIWPLFIVEGSDVETELRSMPGVHVRSIDRAVTAAREAFAFGIQAVAVFPRIETSLKRDDGVAALARDGLACRTARALKNALPELGVIGDVALDPYTVHGHDGLVERGRVDNDKTVEILAAMAVIHADAGFDMLAPSDMMDGRIGAIRDALDDRGHAAVPLVAYAAKYASSFYGPFREAVGSATAGPPLDKGTYQMDCANRREALREVELDLAEGADVVMVKPGLPYLDVLSDVKRRFNAPTFAYQVSGEYAMLRAAADAGYVVWADAMGETLLCMRRAGADAIFTYAALDVARRLYRG